MKVDWGILYVFVISLRGDRLDDVRLDDDRLDDDRLDDDR